MAENWSGRIPTRYGFPIPLVSVNRQIWEISTKERRISCVFAKRPDMHHWPYFVTMILRGWGGGGVLNFPLFRPNDGFLRKETPGATCPRTELIGRP